VNQPRPPVWHLLLAVLVGGWVVGVTLAGQLAVFVLETIAALTRGAPGSDSSQVLTGVVAAVLVTVPPAVLSRLPLAPGVRAALRAWAVAGAASAVLALARAAPAWFHEAYLLGLAALAVGCVLLPGRAYALARRWLKRPADATGTDRVRDRRIAVPAALGLVLLVPWVWVGALGGATETVAAAVAAAALGWLAARVLDPLTEALGGDRRGGWRGLLAALGAGLALGVALVPLAGATGEPGIALIALCVLPILGFAVDALRRGTAVLVGLAAFGPLAFVDPEETNPLLGTSDVGFWALIGTVAAFLLAALVALAAGLAGRTAVTPRRAIAVATVLAVAAGVGVVYAALGQPGLYGDRLFVVLKEQADLSGLDGVADRNERLRQTYRRLVDTAERSQAAIRRDLRGWRVDVRPYYLVNGLEVDGGPALRAWLARRSDVDRVLTNPVLRPLPDAPNPMTGSDPKPDGPLWNVRMLNADRVWEAANVRGAGIVVGSSDSGVDGAHPALAPGFRGGDDSWYDPWDGTTRPTDRNGHGTHTLGSALGRDGIGVAPEATWMGCVNLARNLGSPARYLDCLQFMLAPFPPGGDPFRDGRPDRAAHVLSNSWGCPELEGCDGRVLRPAVDALTAAGIFVVVAAGNTGSRCRSITDEPAVDPGAFAVGAVNDEQRVAGFSSRGPVPGTDKPDAMAPGVEVLSALPGGGYGTLDGTSMAAPHVAGVVALMWAANPRLVGDVDRTADILRSTAAGATLPPSADDCGDARNVRGAGLVDALAAVTAARAMG
jgi:subtilisin family serine protease